MNKKDLWQALLQLVLAVKNYKQKIKFCTLCFDGKSWIIGFNQRPKDLMNCAIIVSLEKEAKSLSSDFTLLQILNQIEAKVQQAGKLDKEALSFFLKYIPYCFLSLKAKVEKRAISIAHFAQSLDGKIATSSGDSKWIGNEENLIHAHRMRALCDAILIGKETLNADQPSLTVRKVAGDNPRRVIIGSPNVKYDCLLNACREDQILWIGKEASLVNGQVQYCQMASKNGKIAALDILALLYQQGLHSVYIEGGAKTTSHFLNDRGVDILQLHIAPIVFGSGVQSIVLPPITTVNESIQFQYFQFQHIGESVMFVGQLKDKHLS